MVEAQENYLKDLAAPAVAAAAASAAAASAVDVLALWAKQK